ncbi:MAG: transglycosylase SLT domain-containing protein [Pseudomonadota bacterium]|nr:transglycosylase SLT domain-containing protein [Pseudomonadota bacterium]MDP1902688.1 transglycosylase SLT domain-containing protein [Pseudomonadota bacterium]MDP2353366.1 transglycosylase SLT domain-containing protein [Pseudomonadota bacterium]
MPELKISYDLASIAAIPDRIEAQSDLWERIRTGFKLTESNPELTRTHEAWFRKHPGHLERGIERSRLYLYFIAEEVEKRGMPMEIALLPMIESAYNPLALSPMKASGIWQFIPSTGKVYGLKQNAWYDGRRDVLTATRAALDYLQYLHGMFGDWELALAAYNCGEGCVARAQSRQHGKSTSYASLKLPTETRHYVPKLIAVRNIVLNPQRFGIDILDVANEPYFMQVTLSKPMEARQAARLADMELDDFLSLNPGFQRRVIHTDTRDVMLLPTERVVAFQFNLHRQGVDKLSLRPYEASRGESAGKIANKFGVTLAWLKEHNPIKLYKGNVAQDQTLLVPSSAAKAATKTQAPVAKEKRPAMRTHTVRKGDTLDRVAKRYDVKVADIRRWNENAEPLRPGTTLDIPVSG